MSRHLQWLAEQSETWIARGIITKDQADAIRKLYPEPKAGLPWSTIIFSGLGAAIIGLGVILLFAYNWQAMPKASKLAVIFVGLIAAQAAGANLFRFPDWRRQLGETVSLFGTMIFGAGIWLVAQIYHIEEHYPTGFMIWGLGALAMAWAMPSLAHGLLAVVILCVWNCTESWRFQNPVFWSPLLILIGAGALGWRQRWRSLLLAALCGFALMLAANICPKPSSASVMLSVGSLFIAVAFLTRRHRGFDESASVWAFVGWTCFLISLFVLTFPGESDRSHDHVFESETSFQICQWGSLALSLAAWGWAVRDSFFRTEPRGTADFPLESWLVPLAVVASIVFQFVEVNDDKWFSASPFNMLSLTLAVAWMVRGCKDGLLRPTLLGALLLIAVAWARYFDLFESLLTRGAVFVVVGGMLFAEGTMFARLRRHAHPEGTR